MKYFEEFVRRRWANTFVALPKDGVPFPMVAAMGLPGETGEVLEHLKKHYRDGKVPGPELMLELGDVLHYLVVIAQSYGYTLDELMRGNMAKLIARDALKRRA